MNYNKLRDVIIQYLNSEYGDLTKATALNFFCYLKNGDWVFCYDIVSENVIISNGEIYSFIMNSFNLTYWDFQSILKMWVEMSYGLNVSYVEVRHLQYW